MFLTYNIPHNRGELKLEFKKLKKLSSGNLTPSQKEELKNILAASKALLAKSQNKIKLKRVLKKYINSVTLVLNRIENISASDSRLAVEKPQNTIVDLLRVRGVDARKGEIILLRKELLQKAKELIPIEKALFDEIDNTLNKLRKRTLKQEEGLDENNKIWSKKGGKKKGKRKIGAWRRLKTTENKPIVREGNQASNTIELIRYLRVMIKAVSQLITVSPDKRAGLQKLIPLLNRELNKYTPYYTQQMNMDILHKLNNKGKPVKEKGQAWARTCNLTSTAMALSGLGKGKTSFKGDWKLLNSVYAKIKEPTFSSSRGIENRLFSKPKEDKENIQNNKNIRLPDFLQLVVIYNELKKMGINDENLEKLNLRLPKNKFLPKKFRNNQPNKNIKNFNEAFIVATYIVSNSISTKAFIFPEIAQLFGASYEKISISSKGFKKIKSDSWQKKIKQMERIISKENNDFLEIIRKVWTMEMKNLEEKFKPYMASMEKEFFLILKGNPKTVEKKIIEDATEKYSDMDKIKESHDAIIHSQSLAKSKSKIKKIKNKIKRIKGIEKKLLKDRKKLKKLNLLKAPTDEEYKLEVRKLVTPLLNRGGQIVVNRDGHYVKLENIKNDGILIDDPASGLNTGRRERSGKSTLGKNSLITWKEANESAYFKILHAFFN